MGHKNKCNILDFIFQAIFVFLVFIYIFKLKLGTVFPLTMAVAFFLFYPGYYLIKIMKVKVKLLHEFIFLSFLFSYLIFAVNSIMFFRFHPTYFQGFIILVILNQILFVISKSIKNSHDNPKINIIKEPSNFTLWGIFLLLWLLVVIFKGAGTMDGLKYFAYIGKLASSKEIINSGGFYLSNKIDTINGYNSWLMLIAFISNIINVEYISIFISLPIFLMPLTVLGIYFISYQLSKEWELATLTSICFLLFHGFNEGLWIWRTSSYLMIVTDFILIPGIIGFIFIKSNISPILKKILAGGLILSVATVHMFAFINLIIILSGLVISFNFLNTKHKAPPVLSALLFGLLLTAPFILMRMSNSGMLKELIELKVSLLRLAENTYIVHPKRWFVPHYHVKPCFDIRIFYLVSMYAGLFLIPFYKKKKVVRYILTTVIASMFLMLNPVIIGILGKVIGFITLDRFNQIIPFEIIFGTFIFIMLKKFIPENRKKILSNLIIYSLIISFIIGGIFVNHRLANFFRTEKHSGSNIWKVDYVKNECVPKYLDNPGKHFNLLKFIRTDIPEKSIFAASYELSLFIAAYSKHFVLCVMPEEASAGALDQKERENKQKILFSKDSPSNFRIEILKKFKIKYIVLEPNQTEILPFIENLKNSKIIYDQNNYYIIDVSKCY